MHERRRALLWPYGLFIVLCGLVAVCLSFLPREIVYGYGNVVSAAIVLSHLPFVPTVLLALYRVGPEANWLWLLAPIGLPIIPWTMLVVGACAFAKACI